MTKVKDFFDLKLAHHLYPTVACWLLAFRKRYSVFKERVAVVMLFAMLFAGRTFYVSGEDSSYSTRRRASSPFQKIPAEIFEGHLLMTARF